MKAPRTKLQAPEKLQGPNSKLRRARMMHGLELGVWDLFGGWNLGFGALPACLGIEQTDSSNLSGVNQVPMYSYPDHEEFGARFRRDGEIFGMSNRQLLAVGEMQLESAKRSPVAHFLKVRDFHVVDPILNRSVGIINLRDGLDSPCCGSTLKRELQLLADGSSCWSSSFRLPVPTKRGIKYIAPSSTSVW